jgi:dTDP-4-amino-4,6-dideoxygalactose transaminase
VVSADPEVIARVQDARLLGVARDSEKRYRGERSWDFDVSAKGWRYHMSDIMAAIGRVQLRRFESEFKPRRRELFALYCQGLKDVAGLVLLKSDAESVVPHIFPVRILDGRRDAIRQGLEDVGIQTGIHYKPNHLLDYFGGGKSSLPVAEKLYEELLTLPIHPGVSEEECNFVVEKIIKLLKEK